MIRRPPRSTLFPYTDALPISLALRAHSKGLELACHVLGDVPDALVGDPGRLRTWKARDRKSTRLNSSHQIISYAAFYLKKKKRFDSLPTIFICASVVI